MYRMSNIGIFSNKSRTFPFENRKNITAIALSPDGKVLITVDEGMVKVIILGYRVD